MNRWIIVSSDLNIKRNTLQRLAILNAGVAAFFFTSAQITSSEQVKIFEKAILKIAKMVVTQPRPFIARLSKNGELELWLNSKGDDMISKRQSKKKK